MLFDDTKELTLFWIYSTMGTQFILFVLYCITLALLMRNAEKLTFVSTLTLLMIISTAGAVGTSIGNIKIVNGTMTRPGFAIVHISAVSCRDLGFNVSHWMFAYEYYMSAAWMPFIYNRQDMPEDMQRRREVFYKVFLWANVAVPLLNEVMFAITDFLSIKGLPDPFNPKEYKFRFIVFTVFRDLVYLLQLCSGILLLVAVSKIRKFMHFSGFSAQVNVKSMRIHVLSFSLYSLAIFVFLGFETNYFIHLSNGTP